MCNGPAQRNAGTGIGDISHRTGLESEYHEETAESV